MLLAQKHMKEIYKMRKDGDQEGLMNLQDTLIAQAEAQVAGMNRSSVSRRNR